MPGFDTALAALEVETINALKSAEGLVKLLKRLRSAAKTGHVADIESLSPECRERAAEAASAATKISSAWQFDARAYLAEGYLVELQGSAEEAGVKLIERDGRIYCFPLLLRIEPRLAGIRIDKKLERRIRPKELIKQLAAVQKRPTRFGEAQFLEILYKAYERITEAPGNVVAVADIHGLLTLMPGSDYPVEEFGRDLLLLDRKPDQRTRSGLSFRFSGSTLAKSKIRRVTVYDESGRERSYIGLRFARAG